MRQALRTLDRRCPELSQWVGGRLDIEVPAIALSVGVHALVLLVLATAGYAVHTEARREFQSQVVEKVVSNELTHSDFQDIDQTPDPPALTPAAGSFSPNLATMISTPPNAAPSSSTPGSTPAPVGELASFAVPRPTQVPGPPPPLLSPPPPPTVTAPP